MKFRKIKNRLGLRINFTDSSFSHTCRFSVASPEPLERRDSKIFQTVGILSNWHTICSLSLGSATEGFCKCKSSQNKHKSISDQTFSNLTFVTFYEHFNSFFSKFISQNNNLDFWIGDLKYLFNKKLTAQNKWKWKNKKISIRSIELTG